MGDLFERVGRAFSFIRASIKMAFKDKDIFIPSLVSVFANIVLLVALIFVLNATDTLWLAGIDRTDIEKLKEAGRVIQRTPGEIVQEKVGAAAAEAAAREKAIQEAMRRGETPEAAAAAYDRKARAGAPYDPDTQPPPKSRSDDGSTRFAQAAFYVVTLMASFFITYFFTAMTISLVHAHLMGRDARVGEAFAVVTKRIGAIALIAAATVLFDLVASIFRNKKGEDTAISAAIREIWTVASYLILPAIVIEDFSFLKAFRRAKEIAAKNLLIIAVGDVAVAVVGRVIRLIGVAGGFVAGIVIFRYWTTPLYVPVGFGGLVIIITMAFVSYVKIAYFTCLYINAMETARVGRRVLPVGPLAAALS